MRHIRNLVIALGGFGLASVGTPAMAGCGYGMATMVTCNSGMAVAAAPMAMPFAAPLAMPVVAPMPVMAPVVPMVAPVVSTSVVNIRQPMSHLRSVTYTAVPQINVMSLYGMMPTLHTVASAAPGVKLSTTTTDGGYVEAGANVVCGRPGVVVRTGCGGAVVAATTPVMGVPFGLPVLPSYQVNNMITVSDWTY
ncbi:MAG: hypothetical protein ACPGVT_10220 [Maricaulaceae bacterium]